MNLTYPLCILALLSATPVVADQALWVETVRAQSTPQSVNYALTGIIEPIEEYGASFRDGGRIIEVNVDVGDPVSSGTVIARVDPTRANAALQASAAALDAAEVTLLQATQTRDRAKQLLDRGAGTQSALDAAEQSFLTALSSRDQADAQHKKARRAAEDTQLQARKDAIVIERAAEPGQVVGAGQSVVTLASRQALEAVFQVPNQPQLSAALGMPATITALDGAEGIPVRVTEISPVISPSGTVQVKMAIQPQDADNVTIRQAVVGHVAMLGPQVIRIPWNALSAEADGPGVWVIDEASMTVSFRPVTIAFYGRDHVDIAAGLTDGDLLVASGSHVMFPGRSVTTEAAQ